MTPAASNASAQLTSFLLRSMSFFRMLSGPTIDALVPLLTLRFLRPWSLMAEEYFRWWRAPGLHETPAAVVDEYALACEAPRDTDDAEVRISIDGGASYGEAVAMYRRVDSAIAWIAPSMGSFGTLVTVGGRGFGASTKCRFGDVDVEASVVSAEELVCSAPVGNGTVAIGLLVDDVAVASRHAFSYVEQTLLGALDPPTGPTPGRRSLSLSRRPERRTMVAIFGTLGVRPTWK